MLIAWSVVPKTARWLITFDGDCRQSESQSEIWILENSDRSRSGPFSFRRFGRDCRLVKLRRELLMGSLSQRAF